jgi:hypothetical protein
MDPKTRAPDAFTFDAPGALGAEFTRCGYRARVVVERLDGTPVTPFDTEAAGDIIAAAADLGDLVMLRRIARGDQRAAAKPAKRKARSAA